VAVQLMHHGDLLVQWQHLQGLLDHTTAVQLQRQLEDLQQELFQDMRSKYSGDQSMNCV
jgi:hypothetical protein